MPSVIVDSHISTLRMLEAHLEGMRTPADAPSGAIRGLPSSPGTVRLHDREVVIVDGAAGLVQLEQNSL